METLKQHISLEAESLSIGYTRKQGTVTVARDLQFSLREGELAAIVGINGIGKSTLLRTLARVQPRLSGNIRIHGRDIEGYPQADLAMELSVVLTESAASGNLTVWELISLGRQPYTNWLGSLSAVDRDMIKRAIQRVGVEQLQHKKCFELSDGQLQKVMIARALAQDTAVMLLDEPTTHLDLFHKVQVLKLLQQIAHETKRAILYTTHEIDLAIQLCDKILILDNNQNPFGDPATLIANHWFESLFPSDTIVFDAGTGSFRIQN
jgi:iron complex transport system ATP-binding protein